MAIRLSSEGVKAVMSEMKSLLPTDFPSLGAPWLITGLTAIAVRSGIINSIPPVFNVAISNVPGPNMTLYFAGAKQISTYPVSIVYHSMALNITLQSYNGWLDFGVIGCRRALPDIANLAKYMQAAHVELLRRSRELSASQTPAAKPAEKPAAKPAKVIKKSVKPAATKKKPAKAKKT